MADEERREDQQLELPSLGSTFRRRRRERHAEAAEAAEVAEPVEPAPSVEPADGPELSPGPAGLPETQPDVTGPVLTATEEQAAPRPRRRLRIHLPGPVAAALTGAVVGLVLVGLTAGSLHLCSSMRGTSTCGEPGIVLLLVITAAAVVLGSLLLRLGGVGSHGSASLLGVGLLVVLVLLALLPVLDEWWVVIVVPALAAVTFVGAWWLTTTYVEPGERAR